MPSRFDGGGETRVPQRQRRGTRAHEDEEGEPQPVFPMNGVSARARGTNTARDTIIALRISAVRMAPMKIPSSWKLHTETSGERTTHGRKTSAAARYREPTLLAWLKNAAE